MIAMAGVRMYYMLDMVVGTPSIMGHMGVGTSNPYIQRIQVESLMGIGIVSKSR